MSGLLCIALLHHQLVLLGIDGQTSLAGSVLERVGVMIILPVLVTCNDNVERRWPMMTMSYLCCHDRDTISHHPQHSPDTPRPSLSLQSCSTSNTGYLGHKVINLVKCVIAVSYLLDCDMARDPRPCEDLPSWLR